MKPFDAQLIQNRIREVALREMELSESAAKDVAFHMTDWLDDFVAYQCFCSDPNALSDSEVNKMLIEFLVHVPNHVAAASKLYVDVPVTDVFGVGAMSEKDENATGSV